MNENFEKLMRQTDYEINEIVKIKALLEIYDQLGTIRGIATLL